MRPPLMLWAACPPPCRWRLTAAVAPGQPPRRPRRMVRPAAAMAVPIPLRHHPHPRRRPPRHHPRHPRRLPSFRGQAAVGCPPVPKVATAVVLSALRAATGAADWPPSCCVSRGAGSGRTGGQAVCVYYTQLRLYRVQSVSRDSIITPGARSRSTFSSHIGSLFFLSFLEYLHFSLFEVTYIFIVIPLLLYTVQCTVYCVKTNLNLRIL